MNKYYIELEQGKVHYVDSRILEVTDVEIYHNQTGIKFITNEPIQNKLDKVIEILNPDNKLLFVGNFSCGFRKLKPSVVPGDSIGLENVKQFWKEEVEDY